ncbi:MAG: hypothetical protein IT379_28230, partial [Deltaproteobacteria bacterium]|nr:hypothetical protein [Deltaproteobacteria bacterium]
MKDVRFAWVALTLAASSACGEAEIDGGARPGSWTLEAGARAALVDRRCEGEACPEYPNPHACDRLEVEVQPDGSICGVCVVGEERTLHCGGPVVGNPYACAVSVASGRACFRCTDLYGTTVLRDCGGGVEIGFDIPADGPAPPEAPPSSVPPRGDHPTPGSDETCLPASRGDGSPCEVCFDREMRVSFDSCTAEAPPSPATPTPMAPPPAAPEPPHAEPTPDAPAAPETPGSGGADGSCPEDAFESGQALFADALNELLVEAGLAPTYAPSSRARADGGADFELGGGACAAIDDDDGGGRLLEDGELRCGYVATVAAARACTRTTSSCASIGRGILAELAASEDVLEDRYECTGSPIVLDLDGDGIRTVQSGARFDLAG